MPSGVYKRTKPAWNKGLTKETDKRIADAEEKKKQTNLSKYGVENVFQSKEVLDKLSSARHSGELAKKASETKQLRYGDSHYNNIDKNKQTKLDRYGNQNYNNPDKNKETRVNNNDGVYWSDEQRNKLSNTRIVNKSQEKAKQTIIAKYSDLSSYYTETANKRYETMRKNGTLLSKETVPERKYYQELLKQYSQEDIIKQYRDERYPFKCDFYIIPEDKFVEIHAFFTHGPHPYDKNNPDDVKLAVQLEDEHTKWSENILYTWTDLDVRKLETAKRNNLNFEAIYWYNR